MLPNKITKNQKRLRAYPTHQAVQTSGSTANNKSQLYEKPPHLFSNPFRSYLSHRLFSNHINRFINAKIR